VKPEVSCWQRPPLRLVLKDGELHLWRFGLESSKYELDSLKGLLAPEEMVRADRLLDLHKKKQFIVTRTQLRKILGKYQKIEANQIKFQYNPHGKPALDESLHPTVEFNLSHSGHWGVLAVIAKFAIGIDLEKVDTEMLFSQLADRYFNADEKLQLAQYPPERQRRGFYRLWTQKEALLKLDGIGFQAKPSGESFFKMRNLYGSFVSVAPGFVCSVATEGKIESIQKFHY